MFYMFYEENFVLNDERVLDYMCRCIEI